MCTVSAHFDQNALVVNMNRDEQRSRFEGEPFVNEQVLYPVDAKQGGTWMGANKQGVVMCLLNLYECEHVFTGSETRGNIITNLLTLGTFAQITHHLKHTFEANAYSAFSLLLFYQSNCLKVRWNGQTLSFVSTQLSPWYFFTSSGLDSINVQAGRRVLFDNWIKTNPNVNTIPSIQLQYQKDSEVTSCFVQRDLVHTKSISQIKVNALQVELNYFSQSVLPDFVNCKTIKTSQGQQFILTRDSNF